jgi:uncharacterized small protein (DUF1192 family)
MEKLTEAQILNEMPLSHDDLWERIKFLDAEINRLRKNHVEELRQREVEYRHKTKQRFRQVVRGALFSWVDRYHNRRAKALLALPDEDFAKIWRSGKAKDLFG